MKTINLKKYYYPLFVTDTFIEVSDEVAEALLLMRREENNRTHKIWYHKAYYSLDCEDGIENCAFDFTAKSPEEILLEQEEEQLFLATLEHLSEAMNSLTDIQISYSLRCRWFRAAVLPLDHQLETALYHRLESRRCSECGALFLPGFNRAKYCKDCAARVRRRKEAERQRKRYHDSTHLGAEKAL